MTFSDIFNEVIRARFKSAQTTSAKRWVNMRDAQIWSAAEWPWKIVGPTALTVTAATATPTLPADIQIPMAVYDDRGDRLSYLPQQEFDDLFLPNQINATRGRPNCWKWNNGVLTLGDIPDTGYSFTLTYTRKLSHYAQGGALTQGPMAADTDYPLYDSEWHELLVMGAMATGLKVENDPTWQPLEQEFTTTLGTMIEHYLPTVAVAGNMQYGADWF